MRLREMASRKGSVVTRSHATAAPSAVTAASDNVQLYFFRRLPSAVLNDSSRACSPMGPRRWHFRRHATAGSEADRPSLQAILSLVDRLEDSSNSDGQADGAAATLEPDVLEQRRTAEAVLPGLISYLEVGHCHLQTRFHRTKSHWDPSCCSSGPRKGYITASDHKCLGIFLQQLNGLRRTLPTLETKPELWGP